MSAVLECGGDGVGSSVVEYVMFCVATAVSPRSACAVSAAASELFVTSSTCVVHSQQTRFMCLKGYEPNVTAVALGLL